MLAVQVIVKRAPWHGPTLFLTCPKVDMSTANANVGQHSRDTRNCIQFGRACCSSPPTTNNNMYDIPCNTLVYLVYHISFSGWTKYGASVGHSVHFRCVCYCLEHVRLLYVNVDSPKHRSSQYTHSATPTKSHATHINLCVTRNRRLTENVQQERKPNIMQSC